MKTMLLCAAAGAAALAPLAAHAQSAGSNLVTLGWFHIMPQKVAGTVTTKHAGANSSTPTGKLIFTGGVLGFLDTSNASSPYFTIGAFVQ